MDLNSELFSSDFRMIIGALYGAILAWSLRIAPWKWILQRSRIHVFFGATLAVTLLWHVRAQAEPVVSLHLLGATTLTLMFGWSLAILSSTVALIGLTLNGRAEWDMFALNALINGVIPISLSQISLLLVRTLLPRNFFLYVLGNGFLTAGIAMLCAIFFGMALLWSAAIFTDEQITRVYLPFAPLLFFPEAFLNGWAVTILAIYRPDWIYSFSDELYLKGK